MTINLPLIIMIVGALFLISLIINIIRGHRNKYDDTVSRWEEEDENLDLLEEDSDEFSVEDGPAVYSSNIASQQNSKTQNTTIEKNEIASTKKMNPIRHEIKRYQPNHRSLISKTTQSSNLTPATSESMSVSASTTTSKLNSNSTALNSSASQISNPKRPIILALNVMAPKGTTFVGYELLQSLLAAGLHFGEMNIFHRYNEEGATSTTKPIFSLASAVEPGTFDINRMGGFSTPGLTLFMQVTPDMANPQSLFETMLEAAKQLADDLGGELYDDKRQAWTHETTPRYLQRLQ